MKKIAKEIHPEKLEEIEFPCEKKIIPLPLKTFYIFLTWNQVTNSQVPKL